MSALEDFQSAKTAWEKSCYFEMDFTISEDAAVYEAIQKFAAYDVGCLVTTDENGKEASQK
jgi:predicted transcriptional regulator